MFDLLEDLDSRYKIKSPILRSLEKHCTQKLVEVCLSRREMTVKDLVVELEKPESTIRKILKQMQQRKKIRKVKKKGKNFFRCVSTLRQD